jgi:phosphoesterase RecJ-like protein
VRLSGHPIAPWFLERVSQARSIALMTHVGPDADGLGSQIAFALAARRAGKQVCIVNEDPLPPRYAWLDPERVVGGFDQHVGRLAGVDLGLIFDAHEPQRADRPAAWLRERGVDVWVVDHHHVAPTLDVTGVVATGFSSSGELVYRLLQALGWPVDAQVALGLYAAISFDTGSFRFLRNQGDTLRVAAELLDTGLDTNPIQEALWASRPRDEVVLLGRILAQTRFTAGGRVAYAALDASIQDGLDVAPDAIGETIPTLVGIEGVQVAMMLKPSRHPGEWKLSLRSKAMTPIGQVARRRGGGGHDHAAGATLTGDLMTLCGELLVEIEAELPPQP